MLRRRTSTYVLRRRTFAGALQPGEETYRALHVMHALVRHILGLGEEGQRYCCILLSPKDIRRSILRQTVDAAFSKLLCPLFVFLKF